MNKTSLRLCPGFATLGLAALLTFAIGNVLSATATLAAPGAVPVADKELKVKGTFEWSNMKGKKHDLLGTLTPDGDNGYKVVWNFKWKDQPVTYNGVVTGNIANGKVSGTGSDGKRNFSFEGTAKDGAWTFQCFEDAKGGKKPQGNGEVTVQK